jgi:hypothetical protein
MSAISQKSRDWFSTQQGARGSRHMGTVGIAEPGGRTCSDGIRALTDLVLPPHQPP